VRLAEFPGVAAAAQADAYACLVNSLELERVGVLRPYPFELEPVAPYPRRSLRGIQRGTVRR
jgi:hypothetical protein